MSTNTMMQDAAGFTHQRPLANRHLLVVEDSEDNQDLIHHFLTPMGASIAPAFNGAEGVDLALTHQFDLILMDIQMPVMDGIEATRRIRTEGITTPIIAYTAFTSDECRISCFNAGCNAFLSKPGSRNTLVNIIQSCLASSEQTHATEAKDSWHVQDAVAGNATIRNRSIYHDDPIVGPLLGGFIERMPSRIAALKGACMNDDTSEAVFLAHQLKGTMLGYGFILDGKILADIEEKIRRKPSCDAQESILPSLDELAHIYSV